MAHGSPSKDSSSPDSLSRDGRRIGNHALLTTLDAFEPASEVETGDVARLRAAASAAGGDVWSRGSRVHVTGSAVILHPGSGRVLLRWHQRMRAWLQVGGHADAGENDPLAIALREGREETGLGDLRPWPVTVPALPVHVVIVSDPGGPGEPEHEHADLRYVLTTDRPGDAVPEHAEARLRWLPLEEAVATVAEDNLRVTLAQVAERLSATARVTSGRRGRPPTAGGGAGARR